MSLLFIDLSKIKAIPSKIVLNKYKTKTKSVLKPRKKTKTKKRYDSFIDFELYLGNAKMKVSRQARKVFNSLNFEYLL